MGSLQTYLRDHYAGATGGHSLAARMARVSTDPADAEGLERLAAQISEEREELKGIMERLGTAPSRVKQLGAWAGEKAGRAKLRTASPEGRVLQFEGMMMGVTGKLQLWRLLGQKAGSDSRLDAAQIARLERQAEEQRALLEELHARAAKNVSG